MRTLIIQLTPLLALGLAAGCSDEDSRAACPAQGLGVTSPAGKACNELTDPDDPELQACQEQMVSYQDFDCDQPQVCFDRNFRQAAGFLISQSASAYGLSFILTNCSTGNQKLVVEKVELLGDDRCNFEFDVSTDVEKLEIGPGEDGLIQARYFPKTPGEDHAMIRVHTNAQNFPTLDLFVCGTGVPRFLPGADSGPSPDAGLPGGTGEWFCKRVENVASCHQQ